jgi:hypothetical protein
VVIDAAGLAFIANGCNATITRSHLHTRTEQVIAGANDGSIVSIDRTLVDGGGGNGLLSANGAIVRVTNSVIAGQTGGTGALLGVGGVVIVSFSTIVDSVIECGTGTVSCGGTTPDGVCIDNSVIVNSLGGAPANTLTGNKCRVDFTTVTPQQTPPLGSNNSFGVDPLFEDPANGNYHLQAGSPVIDAADPNATSNTTDFDDTLRPQGDASDLGAFERIQ